MKRIYYSVAVSLDGFIAGPNGEADWIEFDQSEAASYFAEFNARFDTAIMGRRSFEVYGGAVEGMDTYVFSRTLAASDHKGVTILGEDGIRRLAELKKQRGKDIWLFGGGTLFGSLAQAGLVDGVEIGVYPVLLGEGIPLMAGGCGRVNLRLDGIEQPRKGSILALTYSVIG